MRLVIGGIGFKACRDEILKGRDEQQLNA